MICSFCFVVYSVDSLAEAQSKVSLLKFRLMLISLYKDNNHEVNLEESKNNDNISSNSSDNNNENNKKESQLIDLIKEFAHSKQVKAEYFKSMAFFALSKPFNYPKVSQLAIKVAIEHLQRETKQNPQIQENYHQAIKLLRVLLSCKNYPNPEDSEPYFNQIDQIIAQAPAKNIESQVNRNDSNENKNDNSKDDDNKQEEEEDDDIDITLDMNSNSNCNANSNLNQKNLKPKSKQSEQEFVWCYDDVQWLMARAFNNCVLCIRNRTQNNEKAHFMAGQQWIGRALSYMSLFSQKQRDQMFHSQLYEKMVCRVPKVEC